VRQRADDLREILVGSKLYLAVSEFLIALVERAILSRHRNRVKPSLLLPASAVAFPNILRNFRLAGSQLAVFSRRERVERATPKNSQVDPARRVAMKMGRRRRCSSVTYRLRHAPCANPSRSWRGATAWPFPRWCGSNLPMPTDMRSLRAPEGCSHAQRLFASFVRCWFGSG
jgi:hypothetical protein